MRYISKISCMVLIILSLLTGLVLATDTDIAELKTRLEKEPENVALLKEIGIYYHTLGDEGDKDAVTEAMKYFEKAIELAPDDLSLKTLQAWYGSLLAMVGRDSSNPLTKYFKVKDGLKLMDEAVKAYPDYYEIRMTRAMTTWNLPNNVFGRLSESVNDFAYLINKENATPGYLPPREYRLAYLNIGLAMKEGGDLETAIKCWKKVIELDAESTEAKEAGELIAKYEF